MSTLYYLEIKGTKTNVYFHNAVDRAKFMFENNLRYSDVLLSHTENLRDFYTDNAKVA